MFKNSPKHFIFYQHCWFSSCTPIWFISTILSRLLTCINWLLTKSGKNSTRDIPNAMNATPMMWYLQQHSVFCLFLLPSIWMIFMWMMTVSVWYDELIATIECSQVFMKLFTKRYQLKLFLRLLVSYRKIWLFQINIVHFAKFFFVNFFITMRAHW